MSVNCKICKKTFYDPDSFERHLSNCNTKDEALAGLNDPSASLYRELAETMGLKSGPVSWGGPRIGVYPIERDRLLRDCISNNAGSRIPFEDTVESMILILDRHCLQHEREIDDLKTRLAALEGSKTNA